MRDDGFFIERKALHTPWTVDFSFPRPHLLRHPTSATGFNTSFSYHFNIFEPSTTRKGIAKNCGGRLKAGSGRAGDLGKRCSPLSTFDGKNAKASLAPTCLLSGHSDENVLIQRLKRQAVRLDITTLSISRKKDFNY
jgi:hypothetical protein